MHVIKLKIGLCMSSHESVKSHQPDTSMLSMFCECLKCLWALVISQAEHVKTAKKGGKKYNAMFFYVEKPLYSCFRSEKLQTHSLCIFPQIHMLKSPSYVMVGD